MKQGVCAAVGEDLSIGLNLAGVEEILIWEKGEETTVLKDWFRKMLESGFTVMILSTECGEALARDLFDKRSQGIMLPVTVIIPGSGEDRRAQEMIKRAVGMDPNSREDDV